MLDDHIERFRRQMQAPWDHLRERRVLREFERSLEVRQARRRIFGRAFVMAAAAVMIVAVPAFAYFAGRDFARKRATERPIASAPAVPVTSSPVPVQTVAGFHVSESRDLADGTLLDLSFDARVDVKSETRKRIEIAQSAGFVRYNVPPLPGRVFVVMARGVQVQVKGTLFVVGVDAGKVSVKVERGLVHVAANSGDVELGVGDELSTSTDEAADEAVTSPSSNSAPPIRASHADTASFPSADALLARADAERRAGDLAGAAATLRSVVGHYPNDARGPLAWFTIGKVERARDRADASAVAFRTSFSLAPDGPLGEDALAEEAAAWAAANEQSAARATAAQYLRRFPNGTHSARMQRIVE
jgi:transmembrane sensor